MSVRHKPAAAWSRDSLAAWQYMADSCDPKPDVGASPKHCHVEFLRRWAVRIIVLVNDEMGFCDWYWFLSSHFETQLKRLDPHVGSIRDIEFTHGDFETDPETKRGKERMGKE